jgi:hypothetical protein
MFRIFTGLIAILTLYGCGVSKNPPYISENFEQLAVKHKRIAILPYEPYTTWQKRENGKFSLWQEQIEISGPYLQKKFFTALAKKINKGKIDLATQSFLITNKILKESNISYPSLKIIDKSSLGKLLDVDALILIEWWIQVINATPAELFNFSAKTSLGVLNPNLFLGRLFKI